MRVRRNLLLDDRPQSLEARAKESLQGLMQIRDGLTIQRNGTQESDEHSMIADHLSKISRIDTSIQIDDMEVDLSLVGDERFSQDRRILTSSKQKNASRVQPKQSQQHFNDYMDSFDQDDDMNDSVYSYTDRTAQDRIQRQKLDLQTRIIQKNSKIEQIEEVDYEDDRGTRSASHNGRLEDKLNQSAAGRMMALKSSTPMRTPRGLNQSMNTSFNRKKSANKFNVQDFHKKSNDMSRDDLLKFYQSEMSRIETSFADDPHERGTVEEEISTYEIDSSKSITSRKHKRSKKSRKNNLFLSNLDEATTPHSGITPSRTKSGRSKKETESPIKINKRNPDGTVEYTINPKLLQNPEKLQEWLSRRDPDKEYIYDPNLL